MRYEALTGAHERVRRALARSRFLSIQPHPKNLSSVFLFFLLGERVSRYLGVRRHAVDTGGGG